MIKTSWADAFELRVLAALTFETKNSTHDCVDNVNHGTTTLRYNRFYLNKLDNISKGYLHSSVCISTRNILNQFDAKKLFIQWKYRQKLNAVWYSQNCLSVSLHFR